MKKILVTGGCGFIGSCFVLKQLRDGNMVINLDNLTYASNLDNLKQITLNNNYHFFKGDINDKDLVSKILKEFEVDWIVNFAAESHVDNSIINPEIFIKTNINGTYVLLKCALNYWKNLEGNKKEEFRFLQVSTDEVYGSLSLTDAKFSEDTNYKPSSPYSASKAAADHLVAAWHHSYNLPIILTNCSNNFGPRQHKEKLIPTIIFSCLQNKEIPIYGNGKNIRDWIYVEDHCLGIELALKKAKIGSRYCFGGNAERENINIASLICKILDQLKPRADKKSYQKQISFVKDRAGHDFRYAINDDKARKELGFTNSNSFEERIKETVIWYL
jgi:dTDP-glucose 4,6-dehydratase